MIFGAIATGDTDKLRAYGTEGAELLRLSDGLDDDPTWLWAAISLAGAEGRHRSAIRLAGAEEAIAQRHGIHMHEPFRQHMLPWLEKARAAVPPADQARLSVEGAGMTLDQLLDEAMAPVGGPSPLSPREIEVATLVAEGLSNVDIADRLVISKRTVETHVAHIKTKVGLARRADLVAWVLDGRPVPAEPGRRP